MEIEIGQEKSRFEKFLDLIPKIDKFLWFLDLNLGVLITAVVLIVLFILYGTAGFYEDGLGDRKSNSHVLGPVPVIIEIIVVVVNVSILTILIVGIQKERRKLLVPGLIWFPIYTIFHIVIVIFTIFMYHWIT